MIRRTLCSILCFIVAAPLLCGCGEGESSFDVDMDKVHDYVNTVVEMEDHLMSGDVVTDIEDTISEKTGLDVDMESFLEEKKRAMFVFEKILGVFDKYYGK